MKTLITIILIGLCLAATAFAQAPDTAWTKLYHRTWDECYWVEETSDGGFALLGISEAIDDNYEEIYLIKTDENGDTVWTHTYGDSIINQSGACVQEDYDGGFIIAGTKNLTTTSRNAYIIKTNSVGDTIWSYLYGGSGGNADAYCITIDSDSSYVIAGRVFVPGHFSDVFLLKLNRDGELDWAHTYGDGAYQDGVCFDKAADGGFMIAGQGSVTGNSYDYYLVKTDDEGIIQWDANYGGYSTDVCHSVKATSDGGCILYGESDSFIANCSWAVRVDSLGDTLWTKLYDRSNGDYGYSVDLTSDGGFIFGGYSNNPGYRDDFWFVKTDANGDTLWSTTVGHGDDQRGYCVIQTSDGGYVLVGESNEGSPTGGDFYVVRLNAEPTGIDDEPSIPSNFVLNQNYPNPFNASTEIKFSLSGQSPVRLTIHDVLGRRVETLLNETRNAGDHSVIWDAARYASGMYFARLTSADRTDEIKMLLMK